MPLSASQIKKEVKNGNIIIDPFTPENVKGASVDVRLGEFYFLQQRAPCEAARDPWSSKFGSVIWGTTNRAEKGCLYIKPHQFALCHTHEFVGTTSDLVGDMRGRSSVYRCCITVSSDGNWGDPAFFGRWTFRIHNQNDCTIMLPVGRRIAQIVFHRVSNGRAYAKENGGGKYQTTEDRERIKREWKPEMLLPKLHLDREVTKTPAKVVREDFLEVL